MKLKTNYSFIFLFSVLLFINCSSDDDDSLPTSENTPPTCTITSPEDASVFDVGETIIVAVDAEDADNNLEEVRFYINGIGVTSINSFPYNFQWDTTGETTGNYTIKAEAIDAENETSFDEITITLGNELIANFEADVTDITVGETVTFTDLSSNNATSWSWDFGDNATSNEENPSHNYSEAGIYTVELTVTNMSSSATEIKTDYITVVNPKNYFPLVVDNEWEYENEETTNDQTVNTDETLTVESEEEIENVSIYYLDSTSEEGAISFTNILSNGELSKNETQLLLTGNANLGIDQAELPDFDIDFEGLVVYDHDATNGTVLFNEDQNTTLPEFNGVTLELNVTIESVSLGNLENIDVNGVIYEDVIGSQFIVSMSVEATATIAPLPFPITIDVLEFQEVVNSTNYFANGVGLVQSETNLSVVFSDQLNQVPDLNLEDIMVFIEQKLSAFQVSLEE